MAYNPPSLYVEQELVSVPDANTLPLYACILAPRYGLHRFDVEAEQALLGAYDALNGNIFVGWPDRVAGSTIDLATSIVKIQDAALEYFQDTVIGDGSGDVGLNEADGNRVRFPTKVFKSGNGYTREATFVNRDAQGGDFVRVTYGITTIDTKIAGLVADIDDAVVEDTAATSGNAASTVQGEDPVDFTGVGAVNDLTATADFTGYDGLAYGYPEESYTLRVKTTGGTIPGTVFTVVAANGDDTDEVTAPAYGVAMDVGNYGAQVTFVDPAPGTPEALIAGDEIVVSGRMGYTVPDLTGDPQTQLDSAGNYVGAKDTTYIVTIEQGGEIGAQVVKYSVVTVDGSDASPIATVSAGLYNDIGTYGVTMEFPNATQLVTGDKFTVTVQAAGAGAYRTLVLRDKLVGADENTTLLVTLGLFDTIDLETAFWDVTTTEISLDAVATHTGTYLGTQNTHNILVGDAYVDYRELLPTGANVLNSLDNVSDVEDVLGPAVEANPLSLMVKAALTGGNGTSVYYIQVASDDLTGYTQAVGVQDYRLEPYSLIPHSTDDTICDMVYAAVLDASQPEIALFRQMLRGVDVAQTSAFYVETDAEADLVATLIGTALVGSNTEFIAKGIRPGDTIHINYRPDNKGGITYDSYTVDTVISDTELTVTEAPAANLTFPVKMEVWRTFTGLEYAAAVGAVANRYNDRRVCVLWSDRLDFGGETNVSKAYLAAYIGGLRAAVAPHQPISNYPLSGLDLQDTLSLTGSQLNSMAENGVWIVYEDTSGTVLSRHQLTTDMTDVRHRENSVTTNADSIVRDMRDNVKDLYGTGNVSDEMLELIRTRIYAVGGLISSRDFPAKLGPQLQDINIEKLYKDPVNLDKIIVEVDLDLPEPLNNLNLKFRIF